MNALHPVLVQALADANLQPRHTQVLMIGAGPGGYVAAIRAAQAGFETIVVDENPPGGTCLNFGCIPSKALIHAAEVYHRLADQPSMAMLGISAGESIIDLGATVKWKNGVVARLNRGVRGLLSRAGVTLIAGRAEIVDGKTCKVRNADGSGLIISAQHLVVATGSLPVELAQVPFGPQVLSSTDLLDLTEIPDSVVVLGGGYIGVELAGALAKLGSRVSIVEAEDRLLSQFDSELTNPVARALEQLGVCVMTETIGVGANPAGLEVGPRDGGSVRSLVAAQKIVVTVGRQPNTNGFGLERLGLDMNGPFVATDDGGRTSMRGVWAIGDITGEPMLAHRAMAQAEQMVDAMAGRTPSDLGPIPAVVFSDPEIVSVGQPPVPAPPGQGSAGGEGLLVGRFPLAANGRAMTQNADAGLVRVVAQADSHRVVGIQAVGAGVGELGAAFSLAVRQGLKLEDLASCVLAHPTLGETLAEAALVALGKPLHN